MTRYRLLISILLVYFLFSCKENNIKENKTAVVTFLTGKATLVTDSARKDLHFGDIINDGIIIETDKDSTADLTFSDKSIIRIKPETKLSLVQMFETNQGGMSAKIKMERGTVIHSVAKLVKDGSYQVDSPTMVAGVRGTAFEVTVSDEATVFVADGKVQVISKIGKKEEHVLEKDRGVTIKESNDHLFGEEKKSAEIMSEVSDMKSHSFGDDLDQIKSLPKPKNEEELKKIYDKDIETLILKDGRELRGVTVSMNNGKLLFQTLEGSHFIKEKEVLRVKFDDESN